MPQGQTAPRLLLDCCAAQGYLSAVGWLSARCFARPYRKPTAG
ncbi:hypothetical protein SAMN05660226_02830 [Parapedobacter luteus]|uniref:Uncharacterized protein n=1 Tax=Parapedobacter luteus TaxID=623280 RepID=A0A1T5DM17_9SPHI|nr:hypothetical protein SAMN05660226_02830 [Parapedobacter luteus]